MKETLPRRLLWPAARVLSVPAVGLVVRGVIETVDVEVTVVDRVVDFTPYGHAERGAAVVEGLARRVAGLEGLLTAELADVAVWAEVDELAV